MANTTVVLRGSAGEAVSRKPAPRLAEKPPLQLVENPPQRLPEKPRQRLVENPRSRRLRRADDPFLEGFN